MAGERVSKATVGSTAKCRPSSFENANEAGQRSTRCDWARVARVRERAAHLERFVDQHAIAVHEGLGGAEQEAGIAILEHAVELFQGPLRK